jgi:hypothetical protein
LPASSSYDISIGTGITDLSGNAYGGGTWTFNTGTTFDALQPSVAAFSPANNATNIGDNATIRFSFNKLMDTTSINPSTVTLTSGGNQLAYSEAFSTPDNVTYVTLTPLAPLPDNAAVTLSLGTGINDLVGQSLASTQTITFNTGNGPDLTAPQLVSQNVTNGQTNVPVNTAISLTFNKPLDPSAYLFVTLYSYSQSLNVATTGMVSTNGTTITLIPTSPLVLASQYQLCYSGVTDVEGNPSGGACVNFTTASAAVTTPPQVLYTVPPVSATNVADNSLIEVIFDRPLDPTSLGQVTLTSSGTPVTAAASLAWGNSTVRLTPSSLLSANASYTVTVVGVKDLSGNTLTTPYTFNFATGGTTSSSYTQLLSTSVLVGGVETPLTYGLTNVDVSTTIQLVFSQAVDPASFLYGSGVQLYDTSIVGDYSEEVVPLSLTTVSPDQKTFTLTPNTELPASSQFQLNIGYSTIYDAFGNPVYGGAYYDFSTGTATTATGTALPVYSTGLGAGGVGQLAGGVSDPNWTVNNPNSCCVYSGSATVLSAANLYSSWPLDTANSQWIAWSDTSNGGPAGYTFSQTFNLTGFDPTTAAIQGTIWLDDGGYLYLNDQPIVYVDNSSWEDSGKPGVPFSIGPGSTLFQPGVNTLSVVITSSDSSYEGINVLITNATATATTPKSPQSNKKAQAIQSPRAIDAAKDLRSSWLDDLGLFPVFGWPQEPASPISLNLIPRDLVLQDRVRQDAPPQQVVPQDRDLPLYRGANTGGTLFARRDERDEPVPRPPQ